jgi:hypothetical protein
MSAMRHIAGLANLSIAILIMALFAFDRVV